MSQASGPGHSWTVDQLPAIRNLETSEAFAGGGNQRINDVRRRMVELTLRLDMIELQLRLNLLGEAVNITTSKLG
jgi:hypothetical protein